MLIIPGGIPVLGIWYHLWTFAIHHTTASTCTESHGRGLDECCESRRSGTGCSPHASTAHREQIWPYLLQIALAAPPRTPPTDNRVDLSHQIPCRELRGALGSEVPPHHACLLDPGDNVSKLGVLTSSLGHGTISHFFPHIKMPSA